MTNNQLIALVREQIAKLETKTTYELTQRVKGKVSKQTVYNFVKEGKCPRSDTLLALFDALDILVIPNPKNDPAAVALSKMLTNWLAEQDPAPRPLRTRRTIKL